MRITFSENLRKEQKKALHVVLEALNNVNMITHVPRSLPTGFKGFSRNKIHKEELYKEKDWTWHQSYGKVEVVINSRIKITLSKFNPRKVDKEIQCKIPPFKVWISNIEYLDLSKPKVFFIWCEKGNDVTEEFSIHNDSQEQIDYFVRYLLQMQNVNNTHNNHHVDGSSLNLNFNKNINNMIHANNNSLIRSK